VVDLKRRYGNSLNELMKKWFT